MTPGPAAMKPCGTPAAYRRHLRHGEPVCDPCREAENRRCRVHPDAQRLPPSPCGTQAAYRRHRRHGEPVDDACRRAASAEVQRYRLRKLERERSAR